MAKEKKKKGQSKVSLVEILAIICTLCVLAIITIPALIINDKEKNIMEIEYTNLMKKNELETRCYPSSSEWNFYRRCESKYSDKENFVVEFLKFTNKNEAKEFFEKNTELKKQKIKYEKESGASIKTSRYQGEYKVIVHKWDAIFRITTTSENIELANKLADQLKEL